MCMIGLLTWTTHGYWLAGPVRGGREVRGVRGGRGFRGFRGWVDPGQSLGPEYPLALPGPDENVSRDRRKSLRWPVVRLDARQCRLVIDDLQRIADLRTYRLLAASAGAEVVRVLMAFDDQRDLHQLVQLTKGALSRMLSVAAGDEAARTAAGEVLAHHKWWPRQYSFLRVENEATSHAVVDAIVKERKPGSVVWVSPEYEY